MPISGYMKRLLNVLVAAAATTIVAGTIASASPSLRDALTSVTGATGSTGASGAGSGSGAGGYTGTTGAGSATGETGETEGATETSGATGASGLVAVAGTTGPDFSACVGLTGLQNAMCRHAALLARDPENHGLANSCMHLVENYGRHAGVTVDPTVCAVPTVAGGVTSSPSDAVHGKSGEPHGNGAAVHGQSGESHGQSGESHGQSGESHGNAGGND
jgi:hypothetical protein